MLIAVGVWVAEKKRRVWSPYVRSAGWLARGRGGQRGRKQGTILLCTRALTFNLENCCMPLVCFHYCQLFRPGRERAGAAAASAAAAAAAAASAPLTKTN